MANEDAGWDDDQFEIERRLTRCVAADLRRSRSQSRTKAIPIMNSWRLVLVSECWPSCKHLENRKSLDSGIALAIPRFQTYVSILMSQNGTAAKHSGRWRDVGMIRRSSLFAPQTWRFQFVCRENNDFSQLALAACSTCHRRYIHSQSLQSP